MKIKNGEQKTKNTRVTLVEMENGMEGSGETSLGASLFL